MDHTLQLRSFLGQARTEARDDAVRLDAHGSVAARLSAGDCIAVQSGRVWLTQTGDANDYFVDAGQRHVMARSGRVVIESFTPQAALRVQRGLRETPAARPGFP